MFKPGVDIRETDQGFVVLADVPGAREQDINIQYNEGTLSIAARVGARTPTDRTAILREYGVGDFERSFRIGDGVDVENISAALKDGVLTLRLPKAERAKARKISVQTTV